MQLFHQLLRVLLIVGVIAFFWVGETWESYKYLQSYRAYLKLFSALSAYVGYYKQELKDISYEYPVGWEFRKRLAFYRNYFILCLVNTAVSNCLDCLMYNQTYHLTNDEVKSVISEAFLYSVVIFAFEKIVTDKYFLLIIHDFKCILRALSSMNFFYKTIKDPRIFNHNLFVNLLEKSILNGSAFTLTNLVIRTFYRGIFPLSSFLSKGLELIIPPSVQFLTNTMPIDGITSFKNRESELFRMRLITLVTYLLLDNYWFIIGELVGHFVKKVLGFKEIIRNSPAHRYQVFSGHMSAISKIVKEISK